MFFTAVQIDEEQFFSSPPPSPPPGDRRRERRQDRRGYVKEVNGLNGNVHKYTYGHALNKSLKRAGISSEFKEWSKLAQERSDWRKLIYVKAEFPPSHGH